MNGIFHKAIIITLPTRENNIHTVTLEHDESIHQFNEMNIIEIDPYQQLHNDPSKNAFFPHWLQHNVPITIKLDDKYQHGTLLKEQNQYFFYPGRSDKNPTTHLPDFDTRAVYMIRDLLLYRGHPKYSKINAQLQSRYIGKVVSNHVSARGLTSRDVPTLIQHKLLPETDRKIWDAAYKEEHFGLQDLPAWITITEKQYQEIKHKVGRPLPTMAISTIKYDENGDPKRAKYRIVVLGHLDQNLWQKSDTYAPVLSLIELRVFITLSMHHKRILKSGDFKQAFCQATVPPDEYYILRPPHGCPVTPPGLYWLLQRTLYGLKRSVKHWFDKATEMLQSIGLNPHPHSPCIFKATSYQADLHYSLDYTWMILFISLQTKQWKKNFKNN